MPSSLVTRMCMIDFRFQILDLRLATGGFDTSRMLFAGLHNHRMLLDYNLACIISLMRAKLVTAHWLLVTSFLFLLSCTPPAQTLEPQVRLQTSFYVFRFNPPALVEFLEDFQLVKEIPFAIPPNCGLFNIFAPPVGKYM